MADGDGQEEEQPKPRKKRHKKAHGGHHGGAWKVAYADFVTAMMAFFLLMWLLAAAKPSTKQQMALWFRDPGLFMEMKNSGMFDDPGHPTVRPDPMPCVPTEPGGSKKKDLDEEQKKKKQELSNAILNLKDSNGKKLGFIKITKKPDGLRVTLLNTPSDPIFRKGTAQATGVLRRFLGNLTDAVVLIRGVNLSVNGHTDSKPIRRADGYGNFDLSVDRAAAVKRIMVVEGLKEPRFKAIRGFGATQPKTADPRDPANQRVILDITWDTELE